MSEKQYKSPLVSCIHCREVKSAKGILSHFFTAHTEEGKQHITRAIELSISATKEANMNKYNLSNQSYDLNPKKCKECNTNLLYKQKKNSFCSHSCATTHSNNLRYLNGYTLSELAKDKLRIAASNTYTNISQCVICNKFFSGIRKSCSVECKKLLLAEVGSKGGKASNLKRCKRSKAEIKLYELCMELDKDILHNKPIVDKWDCDIFLPKYNLCIMWNGPWHYQEMGLYNHNLNKVQTRDAYKVNLFKDSGYNVLIYEDKYYTPESAFAHIKSIVGLPGDDPGTSHLSSEYSTNMS